MVKLITRATLITECAPVLQSCRSNFLLRSLFRLMIDALRNNLKTTQVQKPKKTKRRSLLIDASSVAQVKLMEG
jgi:hypothetical protein